MIRPFQLHYYFLLYITVLTFTGCYSLVELPDHGTIITYDQKAYKNISKFSPALTSIIDTNAVYKECCTLFTLESSIFGFGKVSEHKYSERTDGYIGYYRFYGNGHCNSFMLKENQHDLYPQDFDPARTGHRGVYYTDDKGNVKIDLFTQTGQEGWRISFDVRTETLTFKGDTIFLNRGDKNWSKAYVKTKVQKEIQEIRSW